MQNAAVLLGGLAAIAWGGTIAFAQGEGERGKERAMPPVTAKCPVSGETVNLAVSVATNDGPVFFCCRDCTKTYQTDPAKYADKVATQRAELAHRAKIQVTCPVTGNPVDQKVFTEQGGQKVFFCSQNCVSQFNADPGKYKSALANSYTYQLYCPVMGGEISPKSFTTLAGGEKVFFCCQACEKKLYAEPVKYAPFLAEQGYTFKTVQIVPSEKDEPGHGGREHDEH